MEEKGKVWLADYREAIPTFLAGAESTWSFT